ncbi:MAG: metallophosphoesterase family protein [Pseudomonadota bacterium]
MIVGEAQIDPGMRIYAIGDVHGCLSQLQQLIGLIDLDLEQDPPQAYKIIFLGDYVDRGPDNAKTIEFLVELQATFHDYVFILGNHDERLTLFINDPNRVGESFLKWGGATTLRDYGVIASPEKPFEAVAAAKELAENMPVGHREFLQNLKPYYEQSGYFFCHAGVRPGIPLEKQTNHDLTFIRADFLQHELPFEKVIVHGHTPVPTPEIHTNRINVDTKCYETGILTALVLEEDRQRFIQTLA